MIVNCTNIRIEIRGVQTHFYEKLWIEDKNEDNGGSLQDVLKKFASPKIEMTFSCTVDLDLSPGCIYYDGHNQFKAISKSEIILMSDYVNDFYIPNKISIIGNTYSEGS